MKYQITAPLNKYLNDLQLIKNKTSAPVFPCAFLISKDEALLEAGVEELAEKIRETKTFKFDDYLIDVCVDAKNFKQSFLQLMATLNFNAEYTNEFKGILTINLSNFSEEYTEELIALLAYFADYQKDRIYIFYANDNNASNIEPHINEFFSCYATHLKLDKTAQKVNYCKSMLLDKNIRISQGAEKELENIFAAQIDASVIHTICRDLSYETMLHGSDGIINAEIIQDYTKSHPRSANSKKSVGLIK